MGTSAKTSMNVQDLFIAIAKRLPKSQKLVWIMLVVYLIQVKQQIKNQNLDVVSLICGTLLFIFLV